MSDESSALLADGIDTSRDGFDSTSWSMITAASRDDDLAERALNLLCRTYWRPVFVFVRRSGLLRADAEDTTQDFLLYLLNRDWVKRADPARGSFRALLLTLLRNFLANRRRQTCANKRGGRAYIISLNTDEGEADVGALPATEIDPARAYERSWAQCVLDSALARLVEEQRDLGQAKRFSALRPFLSASSSAGEYALIATQLGLTRAQLAKATHTLTRRFGELVRAEVASTLVDPIQTETELRCLLEALGEPAN
jgi:DNA-directed RNA polymerase specialized sigma24 family protein